MFDVNSSPYRHAEYLKQFTWMNGYVEFFSISRPWTFPEVRFLLGFFEMPSKLYPF